VLWCDLGLKSCAFQPNEATDPPRKSQDRASPWPEVAAVISVACGAILELGIYNDADKGLGSLEPFQGMTSLAGRAARWWSSTWSPHDFRLRDEQDDAGRRDHRIGAGRAGVRDRESLSHVLDRLSVIHPSSQPGFPLPDAGQKKF
jgi:hypothetical protein